MPLPASAPELTVSRRAGGSAYQLAAVCLALAGIPDRAEAQTEPVQAPPPAAAEAAPAQPANSSNNAPAPAAPPAAPVDQAEAPKRAYFFQPRISVGETFTDNVNPGSGIRTADQITELTPGIRFQADTARLKAFADYQATAYYYARGSYGSRAQNALNSFGTFEAAEKRLYLDFSGNISQQSISAFGPQVASNAIIDANRTEVASYRLSPYLRGRLGSEADYELRYGNSWTTAKSPVESRTVLQDWSANIKNSIAKAKLGWSLNVSRQNSNYSTGSKNTSDRARALVSYQFFPDIKASLSAGRESNDYLVTGRETHTTSGYGLDWTPTERTLVSAFREKRFFGQGHTYLISHRTPLMAFKYTDSRDVTFLPNQFSTVGRGTIYDLLYTQLASAIPDPVLRAQQVNNLLTQTGISPNSQVTSSFLTSQVSVSERQEFSVVFNGVRNTATLSASRSVQQTLGGAVGAGDFALSSGVVQKGLSVTWAHRLTPLASITTIASVQESSASGGAAANSRMKMLNVNYSTPIGKRVSLAAGVRTSTFSSNTLSYRENAVLASLIARF